MALTGPRHSRPPRQCKAMIPLAPSQIDVCEHLGLSPGRRAASKSVWQRHQYMGLPGTMAIAGGMGERERVRERESEREREREREKK
jgi:hypothetical protein